MLVLQAGAAAATSPPPPTTTHTHTHTHTAAPSAVAHPYTLDFTEAAAGSSMFAGLAPELVTKLGDDRYNISMVGGWVGGWVGGGVGGGVDGEQMSIPWRGTGGERAPEDKISEQPWLEDGAVAWPIWPGLELSGYPLPFPAAHAPTTRRPPSLSQENHMFGLPPAHYDRWPALRSSFDLLSTSKDRNGVVYVSSAEHKRYPFTATQWHPEKPPFEFGMAEIPHTLDAVLVSQHLANVFVQNARRSSHRPESPEQVGSRGGVVVGWGVGGTEGKRAGTGCAAPTRGRVRLPAGCAAACAAWRLLTCGSTNRLHLRPFPSGAGAHDLQLEALLHAQGLSDGPLVRRARHVVRALCSTCSTCGAADQRAALQHCCA
jgi:hypothetical protein